MTVFQNCSAGTSLGFDYETITSGDQDGIIVRCCTGKKVNGSIVGIIVLQFEFVPRDSLLVLRIIVIVPEGENYGHIIPILETLDAYSVS